MSSRTFTSLPENKLGPPVLPPAATAEALPLGPALCEVVVEGCRETKTMSESATPAVDSFKRHSQV